MESYAQPQTVHCATHGTQGLAFVCTHLFDALSRRNVASVGFQEFVPTPENPEPVALCNECEAVRVHEGIWNEKVDRLTQIRVLCLGCFDFVRRMAQRGDDILDA
jgi:hypothetical protein